MYGIMSFRANARYLANFKIYPNVKMTNSGFLEMRPKSIVDTCQIVTHPNQNSISYRKAGVCLFHKSPESQTRRDFLPTY